MTLRNREGWEAKFRNWAGGPGMREMLAPTSALIGKGLGETVGMITDGRFSGGTWHPKRMWAAPSASCVRMIR